MTAQRELLAIQDAYKEDSCIALCSAVTHGKPKRAKCTPKLLVLRLINLLQSRSPSSMVEASSASRSEIIPAFTPWL